MFGVNKDVKELIKVIKSEVLRQALLEFKNEQDKAVKAQTHLYNLTKDLSDSVETDVRALVREEIRMALENEK